MFKIAVIGHWNTNGIMYYVKNIIEVVTTIGLDEMKETLKADYLIPVSDRVVAGHIFNPDTGIFTDHDKNRIYPPLTLEERITALEEKLNSSTFMISINDSEFITKETKKEYIVRAIKKICELAITNGFNFDTFEDGKELHYSLSTIKQNDLNNIYRSLKEDPGVEYILWRDDSRVTKVKYETKTFIKLYQYLSIMIQTCKLMSDVLEKRSAFIEIDDKSIINTLRGCINGITEQEMADLLVSLELVIKSNHFEYEYSDLKKFYDKVFIIYRDLISSIIDTDFSDLADK